MVDALYAFTECEVTITSRIMVIKDNRPLELTVSEVLRENTDQLVAVLKRELELREKQLLDELHYRTLERIFIEERLYKRIEQCKTNDAVRASVFEGFKPFKKELVRDLADADVERLLQVRIRRISLFDINKHREEMERTKAELDEMRKNLKGLTKYVIGRLETLLAKYGPQYPRLTTKSARHEEVDAKAVAFKAFKVAYDRESGYVGYKVSGEEFKMECTKFDKLLLVFRDGTYKVTELPEKLFVGQELFYCGLPERDRVFTCAYTDREASYLKRFTFGGAILDKAYLCIPEKSRISILCAGHAQDALCALQARAAPESFATNLRSLAGGGQKPAHARPANLVQGHLVGDRRADPRLGRNGGDDEDCFCVSAFTYSADPGACFSKRRRTILRCWGRDFPEGFAH